MENWEQWNAYTRNQLGVNWIAYMKVVRVNLIDQLDGTPNEH